MQGCCYAVLMNQTEPNRAPKRPKAPFRQFIAFLLAGVVLIVILDFFVWGDRPYVEDIKRNSLIEQQLGSEIPPEVVTPKNGGEYFEAPQELEASSEKEMELRRLKEENQGIVKELVLDRDKIEPETIPEVVVEPEPEPEPLGTLESKDVVTEEEVSSAPILSAPVVKEEKADTKANAPARIAIVIDDVGVNVRQSRAAIALPKEVTLAFLPYADKVREMSKVAKAQGHELIIHAPMEAMNQDMDLGPVALRTSMDYASFDKAFEIMTESFDGYVGVNNHMGSRLTQAPEQMGYLMDQLKSRNLFFLDSRTIHTSIALDMARAYGIPAISRDVFLDHEATDAYVQKALRNVERIAREQGEVVAIGHPKSITMDALNKWIPTLKEKNMVLVPLSELIEKPAVKLVTSQRN